MKSPEPEPEEPRRDRGDGERQHTLCYTLAPTHTRRGTAQTSYMRHKSGNGSNPTSNSLSSRLVDRGKQTDPRHSEWGFTN